jgi:hypothetical protein
MPTPRYFVVYLSKMLKIATLTIVLTNCRATEPRDQSFHKLSGLQGNVLKPCSGLGRTRPTVQFAPPAVANAFRQDVVKALKKPGQSLGTFTQEIAASAQSNPGISAAETHRLIYDAVSKTACDGSSSCRRFLPVGSINKVMDDAYALSTQTKELSGGQGNFIPELTTPPRSARPFLPVSRRSLLISGCASFLAAWSLRDDGAYASVSPLNSKISSYDLRYSGYKPAQSATSTCHIFASLEMLRHSPQLTETKKIDRMRFVAELWAHQYGPTYEEALKKEIQFIRSESTRLLELLNQKIKEKEDSGQPVTDKTKKDMIWDLLTANDDWIGPNQGGYAVDDFAYLQKFGALTEQNNLPKVSIEELVTITEKIENERLAYLYTLLLHGENSVSDGRITGDIGPYIKKIYKIADDNWSVDGGQLQRTKIRKELSQFSLEYKYIDKKDMSNSIAKFMGYLQFKQPAVLSVKTSNGGGHAITLVGYDSSKEVFFVRNSATGVFPEYLELNADELFQNLFRYAFLLPSPRIQ